MLWKNANAVLISYFHGYNSFSYAEKIIMAYVHQLLNQPSQWQTSQQAAPGSVPKFTSTSITVKQLLIKNKNINQSKSSLLIWHYVSYLFLFNLVVLFFFLISRLLEKTLFYILELFKEAWECGYNNNNIEENGKDYQRVFDTDSSALCPHW